MHRPRILLTTGSSHRSTGLRRIDSITGHNYSMAVVQAGGLPVMVANLEPDLAGAYAQSADGVLFTGGADVDPAYFGQEPHPNLGVVDIERDAFELALYAAARERGLPILGICRGIQVINVAHGGSLHQHVPALESTLQHSQADPGGVPTHTVTLEEHSRLARALRRSTLRTNSYHHQAVADVGAGLTVTGRASDGIIEALEGDGSDFLLGVQWHPEMSFARFEDHFAPFRVFLDAVLERQAVR